MQCPDHTMMERRSIKLKHLSKGEINNMIKVTVKEVIGSWTGNHSTKGQFFPRFRDAGKLLSPQKNREIMHLKLPRCLATSRGKQALFYLPVSFLRSLFLLVQHSSYYCYIYSYCEYCDHCGYYLVKMHLASLVTVLPSLFVCLFSICAYSPVEQEQCWTVISGAENFLLGQKFLKQAKSLKSLDLP